MLEKILITYAKIYSQARSSGWLKIAGGSLRPCMFGHNNTQKWHAFHFHNALYSKSKPNLEGSGVVYLKVQPCIRSSPYMLHRFRFPPNDTSSIPRDGREARDANERSATRTWPTNWILASTSLASSSASPRAS